MLDSVEQSSNPWSFLRWALVVLPVDLGVHMWSNTVEQSAVRGAAAFARPWCSVDLGVRMWSNMPGDVGFMCLQARLSGLSH